MLSFDSWQQFYFADSPDEILEDGDGLNTLAEFAFNLDPTSNDEASPLTSVILAGEYAEFTFPGWREPNGVTYEMESSDDLDVWGDSGISVEAVGGLIENDDGTETVTLRATVSPGLERHFFRLQLSQESGD